VQLANNNASLSRPVQQDIVTFVAAGQRVFFEFVKNAGNVNPSPLTLRIARGQKEAIINHDLYINDSSPGWPGVVMNPANAIPKRYSLNYPAGEGHQSLQNGIIAVLDAFNALGPVLYTVKSDGFTVLVTPTMPSATYIDDLASNQIDTFWAVDAGATAKIISITQDGTVGSPITLTGGNCATLSPNAGNTKVYFARSITVANTALLVIDTSSLVISTFLPGVATKFFGANIMMMTDNTLLVPYEKAATDTQILRYDESGTLLNTYTLTGVQNALEHIFADPADPLYFWVWWQTATLNRFQKITVADGTVAVDDSRMKFVEGVSQTATVSAETVYSGADFSCVPIILRIGTMTQIQPMRRQRRFLLPSSDDNKNMNIPVIELLMRTGIGLKPTTYGDGNLPLGADPQVMIRMSKDGGSTWTNERWIPAGKRGRFFDRVRLVRATGNYRNGVLEVTVSDPVDFQFLAALGDPQEGTS
jgi:hypothetical protein